MPIVSKYWLDMPDMPISVEQRLIEDGKLDPDRLHLKRYKAYPVYFIVYKQRPIGRVDAIPIVTKQGVVDPPILLYRKFPEQLVDRIKDLVNKRDGKNRDIVVRWSPDINDPRIQRYLRNKKR